jgi:hypothetical protein
VPDLKAELDYQDVCTRSPDCWGPRTPDEVVPDWDALHAEWREVWRDLHARKVLNDNAQK